MSRLVVLGASNVVRGFHILVRSARGMWGDPVQVFGAFGHGRSYGSTSALFGRRFGRVLPSILECGIWPELERQPPRPTRALVTDIGNDIAYGTPPERILEWVQQCLGRLRGIGAETVVAGLPLHTIERLSPLGVAILRAVFFPFHRRIAHEEVITRVRAVAEGLPELARRHGARFVPVAPEWYGLDPIHFRPRAWSQAWRGILLAGIEPPAGSGRGAHVSVLRLYLAPPQWRRLLGVEQTRPQPALRLAEGTTIWLY